MQNKESSSPDNNRKLSLRNGIKYTSIGLACLAFLTIATNNIIDLFSKWKARHLAKDLKSSAPSWINNIDIDVVKIESMLTTSITDIIKIRGTYDSIPNTISYKKNGETYTLDVSDYISTLENAEIGILDKRGKDKTSRTTWLIDYLQKDFQTNQCIIEDISSQRIGIQPDHHYWDKVARIQEFVRSSGPGRDILGLGEKGNLSALSDYQLPWLASLMIRNIDCNNKTGLFVQFCRANGIPVGIGHSPTHIAPFVYTHEDDVLWQYLKSYTNFTSRWTTYNWIVVDPSNTSIENGKPKPALVWDMTWGMYNEMKVIFAESPK